MSLGTSMQNFDENIIDLSVIENDHDLTEN